MMMENPRLYYGPNITTEVLRAVVKGATTQEELSEAMGVADRTVHNRVHDPAALGLLDRDDNEYSISEREDVMKLLQLEDRTVLKQRFVELPGVKEVRDELNGGRMPYERVGRLISFHTNSQAIDEDTFINYGRTYARWFDYLRMGFASEGILYSEKPPGIERGNIQPKSTGSGYPKVRPKKVFDALPILRDGVEDKKQLSDHFDFSERYAGKLLSTCYSLGLAERDNQQIFLTDFGEKVLDANEHDQKSLISEALLEVEFVEEYCELAPDGEFKNQELVYEINEVYDKDWGESTVQTRAKRIYSWLVYSDLFKEVKRGILVPNASTEVFGSGGGQESFNEYVEDNHV